MSTDDRDQEPIAGRSGPLADLGRQDLDLFSVEALGERIEALEAEISRSRAAVARKTSSRAAAESLFRSAD